MPSLSLNAVHAERRSAPASPEIADIMLQAMAPHVEHCSTCATFDGTGAVSNGCICGCVEQAAVRIGINGNEANLETRRQGFIQVSHPIRTYRVFPHGVN